MVTYEQHKSFLEAVHYWSQAELEGFLDAKTQEKPCCKPGVSEHYQRRYMQGFEDGKAKLMQEVPA